MLTTQIVYYCNHLLASTLLYLTLTDSIQRLANNLDASDYISQLVNNNNQNHYNQPRRMLSSVLAKTDAENQDYYEILGVKKDATKHEIHRAFRQMAKKYHPDKNKDKNAQDEFIKIFKAYETLSDEKKRKEYDNQSKMPNYANGHHASWQSQNMNDFDINDFFKQYEDQFVKHAQYFTQQHQANHHKQHYDAHNQHHQNHHQHHDQFSFHGVNLDDLFHDIDEDEFANFGRSLFDFAGHNHNHIHVSSMDDDGTFGDGASFFGSHFDHQDHLNQHYHYRNEHSSNNHNTKQGAYSCQTITKQVNGMVMTQTSCM